MNNSQTAFKVRGQLAQFLGIFSPHFSKPVMTFLGDMLYGLQASKDVKLSCIGRGLDEDILLKKTEERLSRNLGREGLDEGICLAVAREGAKRVGKDTLVVVDPTDIRKLYARKMPYLATVRDGSKGELGNGYWGCAAVACESGGRRIVPLHLRLWSCESPGFTGENDQIKSVIGTVSTAAKKRGIYVIDRGGDREILFNHLLDNGLRFIIRLLDYTRLKNMMAVVLAAAFFTAVWLGESVRRGILVRNITRVSKRLFGVPDFHYYALADGIARLFNRCGRWCRERADHGTDEMQQELPLFASG